MDGKTHRESMREGREKFKSLSRKEKIGYIWDYYRGMILGILATVLVVCICVQTMRGSGKDTILSAAIINAEKTEGSKVMELQENFGAYLGLDEKTQSLSLDDTYIIDLKNGDQVTVACQTKLMAGIQAGTLDLILMPEDIYEKYLASGAFAELEGLLGKEFLEEVEDIWCTGRREGDSADAVYGLKLAGSDKLKDIYGNQEVYIAVPAGAAHSEEIRSFVKYLLS